MAAAKQLTSADLAEVVVGGKGYDLCAIAQPIVAAILPGLKPDVKANAPYELFAAAQAAGLYRFPRGVIRSAPKRPGAIQCSFDQPDSQSPDFIQVTVVTDEMLRFVGGDQTASAVAAAEAARAATSNAGDLPNVGSVAWTDRFHWEAADGALWLGVNGTAQADPTLENTGSKILASLKAAVAAGTGTPYSFPKARVSASVVNVTGTSGPVDLCTFTTDLAGKVQAESVRPAFGFTSTYQDELNDGSKVDVQYAGCTVIGTGLVDADVEVRIIDPARVATWATELYGDNSTPAPDLGAEIAYADGNSALVSSGGTVVQVDAGERGEARQAIAGEVAVAVLKAITG